jgi:hypothetical protein
MTDRTAGDSTNALSIPATVQVAAGYANGAYEWIDEEWARFPADRYGLVKIDVTGELADTADVLDVENGDATPATAAEWVASWHALKRGGLPVIYCNQDTRPQVQEQCDRRGLVAGRDFGWWIATLDGTQVEHHQGDGIVACQWMSHGTWDESAVYDPNIWRPTAPPAPPEPKTTLAEATAAMAVIADYLEGK